MFQLAWRNLIHDRTRFVVTVLGIAFAVSLMTLQSGLLVGFTMAASRLIDAYDADIWIMPRGVTCFDFSAPLEDRTKDLATGISGVADAGRVDAGFTVFQEPNGFRQLVLIVGADDRFDGPVPHVSQGLRNESILIDETDALLLVAGKIPSDVEINGRHGKVIGIVKGFSSFLGAPFVFTSYHDSAQYLQISPEQSMFVLIRASRGKNRLEIRDRLRKRFPNYDVWTSSEFSRRARIYWLIKTGAGGALSLSALLGFVIGLVIISQTTYATTMENIEEYATLKAIGASRNFVRGVVVIQALCCGVCGGVLGFLTVAPIASVARNFVTWVIVPGWIFLVVAVATLTMCVCASILGVRAAIQVDPAKVFRA